MSIEPLPSVPGRATAEAPGLTSREALARLESYGSTEPGPRTQQHALLGRLALFANPLVVTSSRGPRVVPAGSPAQGDERLTTSRHATTAARPARKPSARPSATFQR
jgi:hypothetical protein